MSMLSAQCDELRELALWLDDEFYDVEATKVRDAADTIWELRNKCANLVDENARLCSCLSDDADNARQIMAENAKLRELVGDMWFWHYEGHIDSESQERQMLHIDAVIQRMRELGVEVTE